VELSCLLTMILVLLPMGSGSRFEQQQLSGSCESPDMSFVITKKNYLVVDQAWSRYMIPLPPREDRVRLTYRLGHEYAYLGSCAAGLRPYHYRDTTCQAVMVSMGPKEPV